MLVNKYGDISWLSNFNRSVQNTIPKISGNKTSLEEAILKKHHINNNRKYELINGVHVRTKEADLDISPSEIKEKYNLN